MGNIWAVRNQEIEIQQQEDAPALQLANSNLDEAIDQTDQRQDQITDIQISLNVGGEKYSTTGSTLKRESRSMLARMVEMEENRSAIEHSQELFIDRDGRAFGHILNYLRNGDRWVLPSDDAIRNGLLQEAQYYRLDGLAELIKCAQNMKMAVSSLQTKPAATVKIVILGTSGVGKTSLLQQYCDNTFNPNQVSTVGIDYRTKLCSIEGSVVKFYFWDTSGQERYASLTRSYYRGSKGAIFVFDVTNRESFMQLSKWITDFDSYNAHAADGMCPKMVVANKTDLEATRAVSPEEGEEFANRSGMMYAETSAVNNIGVQNAFEEITQKVLQNPQLWDDEEKTAVKRVKRGEGAAKRFGLCC